MPQPQIIVLSPEEVGKIPMLEDDNDFTGINKFGSSTNYTQIDATGNVSMVGTARTLMEIKINANVVSKGASAPTQTTRAIGASGGVAIPVLQFSKTTQQDVYFDFHPQDDMDNTVNVNLHVMWQPGASWSAGNYMWKAEYLVKYEDASYGDADISTGTPTTISMNVTPANNHTMIETHFTDTIDLNTDQVLFVHFYRDVANDNADDVGSISFWEIEYTKNKLGENI